MAFSFNGREEPPVIRASPGEDIRLSYVNQMSADSKERCISVPCTNMTNLHFHGLHVSPDAPQDDVLSMMAMPGQTLHYVVNIPLDQPPGLYWYHTHPHGESYQQGLDGMSGAIVIDGIERYVPELQHMRERILVLRDQIIGKDDPASPELMRRVELSNNSCSTSTDTPERMFTVNGLVRPQIAIAAGERQFWRVVNASTQAFMTLQLQFTAGVQQLEIVGLDGIPLQTPLYTNQITLAPAERVEFITPGLPTNQEGQFVSNGYDSGPVGNPNPPQELMKLFGTDNPKLKVKAAPTPTKPPSDHPRFAGLLNSPPVTQRGLYFSEQTVGSNGPTQYFMTVNGQKPHVFKMDEPPAIVTNVGAIEDWTIENHSGEAHDFHIHQVHFLLMAINGVPVTNPELYDSFPIPNWSGSGPYPSITVRMDFSDPGIAGTFVFHCHILDHEDGGMMAKIQVNP